MKQHQNHKKNEFFIFVQHLFNIWPSNLVPQWPCDTSAGRLCDAGGVHLGAVDHEGPSEGHRCENHRRWSRWYLGRISPSIGVSEISIDIRYPKYVNYVENWIGFGDSTYFAIKSEVWDDEIMGFEGSQVHKSETSYGDGMGHITLLFGGWRVTSVPTCEKMQKCILWLRWQTENPVNSNRDFHTYYGFLSFHSLGVSCVFDQVSVWTYNLSQLPSTATPVEFQFFPSLWRSLGQLRAMTLARSFEEWSDGCRTSSFLLSVAAPLHVKGGAVHSIWTLKIPLWYVEVALIFRSWVIGCHSHSMSVAKRVHIQQLLSCCLLQPRSVDHQLKEIRGMLTKWETAPLGIGSHFLLPQKDWMVFGYMGIRLHRKIIKWWRLLMLSMPEVTNTSMMYDGWWCLGPQNALNFDPHPTLPRFCEELWRISLEPKVALLEICSRKQPPSHGFQLFQY